MAIDNVVAEGLGLPPLTPAVQEVPAVQEIVAQSNPNKPEYDWSRSVIVGKKQINPYENINPNKNIALEQYETIGGSDLSVYLLMETPMASDLGLPKAAQRKDFITIELDNAISLSYSTIRERFPVRAIGHINAKAVTRGCRTISGHIAFAVFTKDTLQYLRSRVAQEIQTIEENAYKSNLTDDQFKNVANDIDKYYNTKRALMNKVQLLDDLPVFHILCMGSNENGVFSKFLIKNVSIIDENQYQGTQQPNIINKVTWVAQDLIPMNVVDKWNISTAVASSVNSYEESMTRGVYNGKANFNYEVTGNEIVNDLIRNKDGA